MYISEGSMRKVEPLAHILVIEVFLLKLRLHCFWQTIVFCFVAEV